MPKKIVSILYLLIIIISSFGLSEAKQVFVEKEDMAVSSLNNPPENVSISGPVFGKSGELTEYSFYCDDPEGFILY